MWIRIGMSYLDPDPEYRFRMWIQDNQNDVEKGKKSEILR